MLSFSDFTARTTISIPLGIPEVEVHHVEQNERGDYIVTVESKQQGTVCQHCGRSITKSNGVGRWIQLRHLPILGHRLYIRLRPKQYKCAHCNDKLTTQRLGWYESKSPHTKAYDQHLMLQLATHHFHK